MTGGARSGTIGCASSRAAAAWSGTTSGATACRTGKPKTSRSRRASATSRRWSRPRASGASRCWGSRRGAPSRWRTRWSTRSASPASSCTAATRAALGTLMRHGWGADNPAFRQMFTSLFVPDGTPEQARWFNELQRVTASPENAERLHEVFGQVQVEALLPRVRVPTLVLHCVGDSVVPFEEGRRLATEIRGDRFVPLEGRNHILLEGEPAWGRFLAEVRAFLDADGPTHQAMPPSLPLGGSAPWRVGAPRGGARAPRAANR